MTASSGSYAQSVFNNPWTAFGAASKDPLPWLKGYASSIFPTGKDTDYSTVFQPVTSQELTANPDSGMTAQQALSDSVPDEDYAKIERRNRADAKYNMELMDYWFNKTREQNLFSMQDMFPWQVAASDIATNRNLAASKNYRSFAEQLPSAVQARALSRQNQADLSSAAASRELDAMSAAYARAAAGSGINYRGTTFNVG